MCGIYVAIASNGVETNISDAVLERLKRRGPDHFSIHSIAIGNRAIKLCVSILHQRSKIVQPYYLDDGSILLYNGEIYDIPDDSDTRFMAHIFQDRMTINLESTLRRLNGEFSCIFIDIIRNKILYFRDKFGRRSLLTYYNNESTFFLSSVAVNDSEDWHEVLTDRLFTIDLNDDQLPYTNLLHNPELSSISTEICTDEHIAKHMLQSLQHSLTNAVYVRLPVDPIQTIAILFSGGIDSLILAKLAANARPAARIDLLSVAFGDNAKSLSACPDRITAMSSFINLRSTGHHNVHFVQINISKEMCLSDEDYIRSLIFPANTVLDLSIASVLFYASRGSGIDFDTNLPYITDASVMLFGTGADELFAGYSRHRSAYQSGSYLQVATELQYDIDRLWLRNCGRDDRVLSDSSREGRAPFLDDAVLTCAISMPLNFKLRVNSDGSFRTKSILRDLAKNLNLVDECETPKRACQFGSGYVKITKSTERKAGHLKLQ